MVNWKRLGMAFSATGTFLAGGGTLGTLGQIPSLPASGTTWIFWTTFVVAGIGFTFSAIGKFISTYAAGEE